MFMPSIPDGANRRMYLFLVLLTLGSTVGMQGFTLLYTNFAVQQAGFSAADNGLVHSFREIPGLLGFLTIPLLLVLREHRLAVFAVIATGIGTGLAGFFPSFWPLMGTTLLMSFGFHFFESINQSLMLQYFDLRTTPLVMGRLRGLAAGGSLAVALFVFICSDMLSFVWMFALIGGFCLFFGIWGLYIDPTDANIPLQRKTFILRSKYSLFYFLTFMMGARRLLFTVFALFLLVEHFGFSVRTVSLLFMTNFAINWFLNPFIGTCINRIGERKLLSIEYTVAASVFIGYAYSDSPILVAILYVLDSIVFNFSIAVRTFFQKIAAPGDIAPTMAVAQTINHLSAVVIPALGGWVWVELGYKVPFLAGAILALISLLAVQGIDRELGRKPGAPR